MITDLPGYRPFHLRIPWVHGLCISSQLESSCTTSIWNYTTYKQFIFLRDFQVRSVDQLLLANTPCMLSLPFKWCFWRFQDTNLKHMTLVRSRLEVVTPWLLVSHKSHKFQVIEGPTDFVKSIENNKKPRKEGSQMFYFPHLFLIEVNKIQLPGDAQWGPQEANLKNPLGWQKAPVWIFDHNPLWPVAALPQNLYNL